MTTNSLHIIYEDEVLLVCNKPAGLMVEPDRNNYANLLQDVKKYLKQKTNEKLPYAQHLHRLDRPTSGIVLFTKQKKYLKYLSEQFAQRCVIKKYVAITSTAPANFKGVLEAWHRKEKKKAIIYEQQVEFSEAIKLDYSITKKENDFIWNINLHTGKYHQIRAQLANLGCPILGDITYGCVKPFKANAIALHAGSLTIKHPITHCDMLFEIEFEF